MAKQDVENYVTANWGQHQETVTELSKEQKKRNIFSSVGYADV